MQNLRLIELTDGGQQPDDIASEIVAFVDAARRSLDFALYDVRLPGDVGERVAGSIRAAAERGVRVRMIYNEDFGNPIPVPPPPATRPEILRQLDVPMRAIPGIPDLMHHKYVVRDGTSVWTGSMNWTLDSWCRQENVVAIADSAGVARGYTQNFEELWRTGEVDESGDFDAPRADVRPWFTPGRGRELSMRIAATLARARRRIRIASPVITTAPVIGTLAEAVTDGRVDVAGVVDATQMRQVFDQWEENGNSRWKLPVIDVVLGDAPFAGKPSTPYAPDAVHDYMHAKVTVADDIAFLGSFNLSRSGEQNAENVLEIHDAAIADRLAAYIDGVRSRYGAAPVPALTRGPGSPGPRRP